MSEGWLAAANQAFDASRAEWLLWWDPSLGQPNPEVVAELCAGRADVWHSGVAVGLGGQPEEHDVIHPVWPLARDAVPDIDAVSWRLSLGAALVRRSVVEALGGLDPAFRHPTGAGLEWGRRAIERGAVIMNTPKLIGDGLLVAEPLDERDRFAFLWRTFGRKWVAYAAARRVAAGHNPWRTWRAFRDAQRVTAAVDRPFAADSVARRPPVGLPPHPSVTVVLPTLGRYDMLRVVLEQLERQTIPPVQVVVTDQNTPERRDPDFYRSFPNLPLDVVFQDSLGQWLARNTAVARATGEWIAFVDDDSEIGPDFIERHLEGLVRYDADLSTGASRAVVGAPIPSNYAFFRVADQWDSGNGMCHRSLFARVDGFDGQFDRQRRGDAEFGLRVQLDGGLVIHNPDAIRVHLKAPDGGLRTFGSLDGFRHRDRSSPLPLPSMRYYTARYHSRRQQREDLLIGLTQAVIPYELKRRASPWRWTVALVGELVHLPSTVRRVRRSGRLAATMVADGPSLPGFRSAESLGDGPT